MNTVEVITTIRITKAKNLTPAQINKIVQGIRQGEQQLSEAGNSHTVDHATHAPNNEKKKLTVELECGNVNTCHKKFIVYP
jgi:hypothetical protein